MVITLDLNEDKPSPITYTGWSENVFLAKTTSNRSARYQGRGGFSPFIPPNKYQRYFFTYVTILYCKTFLIIESGLL